MIINPATSSDTPLIHDLMMKAFREYKNDIPSSSALEETVQSVSNAFGKEEQAMIAYEENQPLGMMRFQLKDEGLYFYRLSVISEKQEEGIAKKILKSLESYATKTNVSTILCKVRVTVTKNLQLYNSVGYHVYDKEIVHKTKRDNY